MLEELYLEKNYIQKIENLSHLIRLKKLELGSNQISKIENLSKLKGLQWLSLEDNKIKNIHGNTSATIFLYLHQF